MRLPLRSRRAVRKTPRYTLLVGTKVRTDLGVYERRFEAEEASRIFVALHPAGVVSDVAVIRVWLALEQ
jgi:hypothetical protein